MAGFKITEWNAKKVHDLATKANVTAMKKAAFLVEADIKKSFTTMGSGHVYGKRKHKASSPGEPPAIDTGILRASIMSDVTVKGGMVIGKIGPDVEKIQAKSTAGTDKEYGLYLELGTKNMQPRPFLRPAVIRNHANIKRIFKEANK